MYLQITLQNNILILGMNMKKIILAVTLAFFTFTTIPVIANPDTKEKETKSIMKLFFNMMMKSDKDKNNQGMDKGANKEDNNDFNNEKIDEKNSIAGKMIFG